MNANAAPSRSFKTPITILLVIGLAWMWWSAVSKKSLSNQPTNSLASATPTKANGAEMISLPSSVSRPTLDPSDRDPFSAYTPPVPKAPIPKRAPAPPVAAIVPIAPQAVAAPSPPALNLRFLGQATTPAGDRLIYAAVGETPVLLSVGTSLPNGYQVTRIDPKAVQFTYAPLNYTAQMLLPEPPRYEIR